MKVAWKVFKVVVIVVLFLVSVFFLYKGYLVYFKYHIRNFQYTPVQGEKAILTSKECSLSLGDFSICLPDSFSLDVDKTVLSELKETITKELTPDEKVLAISGAQNHHDMIRSDHSNRCLSFDIQSQIHAKFVNP